MDDSMRTAASGMMAQQRMVDVIANNLANVNTTGFKRSRVNFQDVLYETLQGERIVNQDGTETTGPVQIGKGVRIAGVTRLDSQGSPETTSRSLDVAIEGDGYLQVQRPTVRPATPATATCRCPSRARWSPAAAIPSCPA